MRVPIVRRCGTAQISARKIAQRVAVVADAAKPDCCEQHMSLPFIGLRLPMFVTLVETDLRTEYAVIAVTAVPDVTAG